MRVLLHTHIFLNKWFGLNCIQMCSDYPSPRHRDNISPPALCEERLIYHFAYIYHRQTHTHTPLHRHKFSPATSFDCHNAKVMNEITTFEMNFIILAHVVSLNVT